MIQDYIRASRKLSELELFITLDGLEIEVLWFRAMPKDGEWFIKRHMHSSFEFHFINKGSCKVFLDDGSFEAGAGEFYLTAPGVYHAQSSAGSGKFVEYSLNCDIKSNSCPDTEAHYIYSALTGACCKPYEDKAGINDSFERALEEAYSMQPGFHSIIKQLAAMMIINAARIMMPRTDIICSIPLKSKKDSYRVEQIEKFIEDNINNPISPKDVAKYMFLSDRQVCRIVQDDRGMSTKELIEFFKFQKARELLKYSSLSVKQVSDCLGFSSEYYFTQFFKRKEGYPPRVFRNNVKV